MDLLLEELSKALKIISQSVLSESTLTQVMKDPLGHKLAKWMHVYLGIADDAKIEPVGLDYIKGKATWSEPEFIVFKGKKGWVLRRPNSFVPIRISVDNPDEVDSGVGTRPDGQAWEDYIEPVAVYRVTKAITSPKVMARDSRQRSFKAPELAIAHRLLEPSIVSSVIHGAKVQLKRQNPTLKFPRKPEVLKSWFSWLDGVRDSLVDGSDDVMDMIDWDENDTPEDERYGEAEDFWNALVYQAVVQSPEWKSARADDAKELQAKYPNREGAYARGINYPNYASHTQALARNTVYLQKVKNTIIDNLVSFTLENSLV